MVFSSASDVGLAAGYHRSPTRAERSRRCWRLCSTNAALGNGSFQAFKFELLNVARWVVTDDAYQERRYTRVAVPLNSACLSAFDVPAAMRLNAFHSA